MPGPLPAPTRRRRNAPTIPSTKLPAFGFDGRPPTPPRIAGLGKAGKAWWRWAWSTPQSAAWDVGSHQVIARRARLEDDLVALEAVDFGPVPTDADELDAYLDGVKRTVAILKRLAGGEIAVMREMRELDDRLGLNPKAAAQLRYTFVADQPVDPEAPTASDEVAHRRAEREARLAAPG